MANIEGSHDSSERGPSRRNPTPSGRIRLTSHRYAIKVLLRTTKGPLLRVGVSLTVLTNASKQTAWK